ncbi:MAG: PD-(D/E)XK nuclease family protein [Selenomonadaceae bacterium]|nr:PD-(D/E)XK nuclease family protein [Selenomonadaceae bacterium]
MAVEIFIGRAGTGKTFALLERMKKILKESPLSTEIIFLLPAYQTYRAELELAEITGGAVNTKMCSFQRFARQILSEVGGATVPRISEIGRRIILRKILKKNSKNLRYYQKAADQRGFTEILAQELKELCTYSIDADKLKILLDNSNFDDELKNKLHDIALISEKFRAEIEERQNDESDLLEKAAELIKDSASIKRAEIFIDGFIFFDPQQRKILQEIFRYAKNVHIALPMDINLNSRENVMEIGLFHRSFETFKILRDISQKLKLDFNIERFDIPRRFESDELKFIERNFFAHSYKKFDGDCKNFKIVEAVNKRVEVEAVARDILKIHREKNFRFRDVGIIFRDDSYNDLIKPIFEIHKIPYFIDRKRAAANHPLAELIRSSLEILKNWKSEPIFRCLRTGFFDIEQEDVDILENYVLEFGLYGKKIWTREENWNWYRHDFQKNISENEIERVKKVDEIRRRAVEQLINFSKNIKSQSAKLHATNLFEFIENLQVHDKLLDMSEIEENRGNLALSKEHLKIWDDIIDLLEQIANSDEDLISLKEFDYIVNEGLDALEMSLIPPSLDAVTVSQFDQNSLQNSKAIYILGFSDEKFPRSSREKLLLSDADRLHLNDAGLEISKGGSENLLAEKFLIYRGLTEARNYLQISYPLANAEGDAMRPSNFMDRLKNFFPKLKPEFVKLDVLENLGTQGNYSIVEKNQNLNEQTARELYATENFMRGSVTRFEKFNKCPFQYFVNYGLNLEERREFKLKPPDVGNILHEILRQYGEILKEKNLFWADVGNSEIENLVTKILDEITPKLNNKILLSTKTLENQRERIKKVAIASIQRLTELDRRSQFHPEIFEITFSALSKTHLVYDIGGVNMELVGTIDRIDFSEDGNYFLIIDYKTGKAYVNLWEIYLGVNLQLLTYLMVTNNLKNVGERMPAAMLYYFLKYPAKNGKSFEEAKNQVDKSLKMSGYTLDEEEIAREIDSTLESLPIKFNKDGTIHGTCAGNVKSQIDFKAMMKFVEDKLKETGKKILGGNISVEPFKTKNNDACKYCVYGEICRLDKKLNFERKQTIDDNEILERMRNSLT